jgi:hypothetical protein
MALGRHQDRVNAALAAKLSVLYFVRIAILAAIGVLDEEGPQ